MISAEATPAEAGGVGLVSGPMQMIIWYFSIGPSIDFHFNTRSSLVPV